jgi:hypothetical protein
MRDWPATVKPAGPRDHRSLDNRVRWLTGLRPRLTQKGRNSSLGLLSISVLGQWSRESASGAPSGGCTKEICAIPALPRSGVSRMSPDCDNDECNSPICAAAGIDLHNTAVAVTAGRRSDGRRKVSRDMVLRTTAGVLTA